MKYRVEISHDGKTLASIEYPTAQLATECFADHASRGAPCVTLAKIPLEGAPITLQRATRH